MLANFALSLQGLNLILLSQGLSCHDERVIMVCHECACCAGRMSLV